MERKKNKKLLYDLIYKFNTVILGIINHITEYYGDSNMRAMETILNDIINSTPDEPISCFLLNIYKNDKYRINILKENDTFFINEKYDEYTNGETERSMKLFEFKHLWKQIDNDTKEFIKKSMSTLVKICQKYVLSL